MDFRDTPEEAGFRARFRAWLAQHVPRELPSEADAREAVEHEFHLALASAGYDWLSLPREYGGQGLPESFEAIFNHELGIAGAPRTTSQGHLAQALARYGTEAQKSVHLASLLSNQLRWCQGFSEPGAGSDLASLSTRADRFAAADGSTRYRLHGQKIWTSGARYAEMCFLLARSEPQARPQAGISVFLVPMNLPGIEVQTITTSWKSYEFAQVFFDGAEIGEDALLGRPGQGWEIARFLLGFERGASDNGWIARIRRTLTQLQERIRKGTLQPSPAAREQLARAYVALRALEIRAQITLSRRMGGEPPGERGSIDKLLLTRADQAMHGAMLDLRGAELLAAEEPELGDYFWARGQSIFGGTAQIQRNLVAQRLLGLPRA
jgi:alkylation response protein AidB-like acyl-CoA dehydrogenase